MDLSQHFSHKTILALAGVSVKGGIPDITHCPFCRDESLFILNDPARGGTHWMYCASCGFQGDAIEVYCKIRKLELREGIYKAIAEGMSHGPIPNISESVVTNYVEEFAGYRLKLRNFWKIFNENITENMSAEVMERLQQEHMWSGWRGQGRDRLAQYLGAAKPKEVRKMFPACTEFVPKNSRLLLVVNYQDIPGRACAFQFIDEEGKQALKLLPHDGGQNMLEGGLAMLDVLRPVEGVVYAVDDPMFALHMHKLHFINSNIPIKLVAFNESTNLAWNYVNASKIVMWTNKLSWRVFDQAKRGRNVYVASRPNPRERELHTYLADMTVNGVLSIMEKSAQPWEIALAEWVTGMEREDLAREAIQLLALNHYEYNKVLEACPSALRKKFVFLHNDTRLSRTIIFNRRTYIEQEDGWWEVHPRLGKDMVSNAIIRVHREVCDTKTGEVYWTGVLSFHGTNVPYSERLDVIEKEGIKWIRKLLAKAGLGTPIIGKSQILVLTALAKAFSNPKSGSMHNRIGIHTDGTLIMPRFTMSDGKIRDTGEPMLYDMPASNVMPPTSRPDFKFSADSGVQALWLCFTAGFVSQQVGVILGFKPRNIVAVGSQQSSTYRVLRQFTSMLGMHTLQVERKIWKANDLISRLNRFEYPTFVEKENDGDFSCWPASDTPPVFLSARDVEAAAICSSGNAVVVRGINVPEGAIPGVDVVLNYIARLQQREFKVDGDACFERVILNDMCKELEVPIELQKLANELLVDMSKGEWGIKAAQLLNQHYGLPTEYKSVPELVHSVCNTTVNFSTARGIFIDDKDEQVFISRPQVAYYLRKNLHPLPDLYACGDDLRQREIMLEVPPSLEAWIVSLADWNRIGLVDLGGR